MKRIVVPLDGSGLSERAIPVAKEFARAYQATLQFVHVRLNEFSADAYLENIVRGVTDERELAVTSHILDGETVSSLLEFVADHTEADETLVVMSTHGRGELGRLVLGSVADRMIRAAAVPIVLVREAMPVRRSGLQTLLVPVDDSVVSKAAIPVAVALARQTGATIDLVRVFEPASAANIGIAPGLSPAYAELIIESERAGLTKARRSLDQMAAEMRANGVRVSWEIRSGRTADEIVRMAETTAADLIIMATHGRGGIRRFVLGSVTDDVLQRGTTPILVVPGSASAADQAPAAEILSTA